MFCLSPADLMLLGEEEEEEDGEEVTAGLFFYFAHLERRQCIGHFCPSLMQIHRNDSNVKLDDKKKIAFSFRLKVKFCRGTFEILIFNIIIFINSRSSDIDINGVMLPPRGREKPLQITVRIWNLLIKNHPFLLIDCLYVDHTNTHTYMHSMRVFVLP